MRPVAGGTPGSMLQLAVTEGWRLREVEAVEFGIWPADMGLGGWTHRPVEYGDRIGDDLVRKIR